MSEMIERVAQAIAALAATKDDHELFMMGDLTDVGGQELAQEFARAAIAAMREPTEAMQATYSSEEDGGLIWRDMIEAALNVSATPQEHIGEQIGGTPGNGLPMTAG